MFDKDIYEQKAMNNYHRKRLIRIVSSHFWSFLPKRQKIRALLYKKILGLENLPKVEYNVMIAGHHLTPKDFKRDTPSGIKVGKGCLFCNNINIDTTGEIIIGNGVTIAEDTLIYTHGHEVNSLLKTQGKASVIPSQVIVDDDVHVGARVVILSTCRHIGRGVRIGAGAVVRNNIPPYSLVVGNPGKVIGFVMTPEQTIEYEKGLYSEEKRMAIEELEKNYRKYYTDRIKDIAKLVKN